MLSLRRLQHFIVLSEEKSISRAARRLHLTQPALTRSLQTLEETLGLALVERRHDGVSLTDAGQTMLVRAQRMLGEARAMKSEADLIRGVEVGRVNFGVGVLPASIFLTDVLAQQVALRPGLIVQVEIESWVRLHEKLQRDELDFVVAMTRSLPPGSEYTITHLPPLHFGYFVRKGHPLEGLSERTLRTRLSGHPLLSSQMPPKAMALIAELYGIPPDQEVPGLRCDNTQVLKRIALQTDGILLSTHETVRQEVEQQQLIPLPVIKATESLVELSLIQAQRKSQSPAALWLMSLIQTHLQPLPG